ncbi:nuclear transport factor 2 family protein [Geodermatophilus sp. SYSU D00710]
MELGRLRVNQLSAAGWEWYQQYLAALDAYDLERYSSFLSPDVSIQFNNDEPMVGREVAAKGLDQFWGSVTAMGYTLVHEPLNVYGDDHRFVLEALNHYDGADGRRVTVRATAWTDRGDDGAVTSVRLYQDLSPLYGTAG